MITIIGAGYVGLVTAISFATFNHNIVLYDKDSKKINSLNNFKSPIYEPNLNAMLNKYKNNIIYTDDFNTSLKDSNIIIIAVGTPESIEGMADLSQLWEVVNLLLREVNHDIYLVIKSTVPVGTCLKVKEYIEKHKKHKVNFEIVSNPEFLSQGSAIENSLNPERIVLGVTSVKAENEMKKIYNPFKRPYVVTDLTSAEMIKYASNCYLALKLSYFNEVANICEISGANILDVCKGVGMDRRIGNKFMNVGIGYGGSCLPKDTNAFLHLGKELGYNIKTIEAAVKVNDEQKEILLKKARKYISNFNGKVCTILGATFKENTDDLRESKVFYYIESLLNLKAVIKLWDPVALPKLKSKYPEIICTNSIEEAIKDSEVCFILTRWNEIVSFKVEKFSKLMKIPLILDGRNCFNISDFSEDLGIIYEPIGYQGVY